LELEKIRKILKKIEDIDNQGLLKKLKNTCRTAERPLNFLIVIFLFDFMIIIKTPSSNFGKIN
jgi:hypothetical protein